jgi:hypothetical protein
MKLVELLAMELVEWPEGAQTAIQDPDRDNTIWYQKEGHSPLYFESGAWRGGSWFEILISEPSTRASDYDEAMITRAQWQAERDRQKGGEWKRHRAGRNQPVMSDASVEVKLRCGDIQQGCAHEFIWLHSECDVAANITQYRVISQPQAEEVEVKELMSVTEGTFVRGPISLNDEVIYPAEAQWQQSSGPLAWRDTIIHCQAIIEECEREIQRNVDLLDAEGLMMQTDSKKAMQNYLPTPIPYADWQDGDIVRCIATGISCADLTAGNEYTVVTRHGETGVIDDEDDHMCSCIECGELEFVRRP